MSKGDIYIRGWGAVTTLGWSASESAHNLIAGNVHPAGVCSSSHLTNRDFKAFEVAYSGNPLENRWRCSMRPFPKPFERAGLNASEIAESALLVGTTGGIFIRNEFEFTESVRHYPGKESPPIACRNRGPGEVADAIAKNTVSTVLAHDVQHGLRFEFARAWLLRRSFWLKRKSSGRLSSVLNRF